MISEEEERGRKTVPMEKKKCKIFQESCLAKHLDQVAQKQ